LEAACDRTREQFNTEWALMVKYAQDLFCLQHNTSRIMKTQRTRLNTYEEQSIKTYLEMERLGHENHILHQGMFGIREKD
jgi:hypothetical protein